MRLRAEAGERLRSRWSARTRRTRLATTLATMTALTAVAVGAWLLFGTGVLGVRAVEVRGASRLDPATVRATAGIRAGAPLARLDTGAVVARLARLPEVRSVEVARRWPGTVAILLRERTAAAVAARGPTYALIDRTGVAFATVSRRPPGLPLVSAPVDAGARGMRAALDVLHQFPSSLRTQVRVVRANSPEDVEIGLTRGRTVLWGSAERGERKAAVLVALVGRRASVYDVSAPDAPTTRR